MGHDSVPKRKHAQGKQERSPHCRRAGQHGPQEQAPLNLVEHSIRHRADRNFADAREGQYREQRRVKHPEGQRAQHPVRSAEPDDGRLAPHPPPGHGRSARKQARAHEVNHFEECHVQVYPAQSAGRGAAE